MPPSRHEPGVPGGFLGGKRAVQTTNGLLQQQLLDESRLQCLWVLPRAGTGRGRSLLAQFPPADRDPKRPCGRCTEETCAGAPCSLQQAHTHPCTNSGRSRMGSTEWHQASSHATGPPAADQGHFPPRDPFPAPPEHHFPP